MIKAIFTDLDNTLVTNEELYDRALALLVGYLRSYGVDTKETEAVFTQYDKALFGTYGYSRARLPASFEQTLLNFVPNADKEAVEIVRGFANEVFSRTGRIVPGAEEAIRLLAEKYPVYVMTAGDTGVQIFRVEHLPFKDLLSGTHIYPKKDEAAYSALVASLGLKPEETIMMGDSLKSDVLPPAAIGMKAVWVEAHNSQFEKPPSTGLPANARKFTSLLEAARHIVEHGDILPPPPKFQTGALKPKSP